MGKTYNKGDKKDNKIGRRKKGKDSLDPQDDPTEMKAKAEHKKRLEQEAAAEAELSAADLETKATETQQQVNKEVADVLDVEPADEPEPIDAAGLEKNTESVQGLEASTNEEIQKAVEVTATPETTVNLPVAEAAPASVEPSAEKDSQEGDGFKELSETLDKKLAEVEDEIEPSLLSPEELALADELKATLDKQKLKEEREGNKSEPTTESGKTESEAPANLPVLETPTSQPKTKRGRDGRTNEEIIRDNQNRLPNALAKKESTLNKTIEEEAAKTRKLVDAVNEAFKEPKPTTESGKTESETPANLPIAEVPTPEKPKTPTTTAEDIAAAFESMKGGFREGKIKKAKEYHERLLAASSGQPLKPNDTIDNLLPDFKRITGQDWNPDIDVDQIFEEKPAENSAASEIPAKPVTPEIPSGGPMTEGPEIPQLGPTDPTLETNPAKPEPASASATETPLTVPETPTVSKDSETDIEPSENWSFSDLLKEEEVSTPATEAAKPKIKPTTKPATRPTAPKAKAAPPTAETATPTIETAPPAVEAAQPAVEAATPTENSPLNPEEPATLSAESSPETETTTPAERNTVIRNIANQGILRSRLRDEALARGENPTEAEINELAKTQADFVKTKRVESLIVKDSKKIKKIFKPEGKELTQDKLKQELLATLLDKKSLASQKKLRLLARQISNETGLDMEQAQELINNQEQRLRDSALAEINAGRVAGASAEEAAANAKAGRKKKIGWAVAKTAAYIGGGALLTGVTGGVGAIAALTGVRIIDRIVTDRLQKKKVDAKFAEMKAQLEADPNERDSFLQQFFTETAVSQQQRISGERNFNFENFAADNPDLLAGYEVGEQEQIMKALGALQRIDQINYIREHDLLERLADKVKKTDNRALGFMEKVATGFNKFMVKGGENTYERAVSAAMLGGAALAAREMPVIRNLMLAMAGWKAGDFAGRMIWGAEKAELGQVDDIDTAQDILDTMAVMEQNKTSDKHKRLLLKAGTSLLFASAPFIVNQVLTHWPTHGAKGAEVPTATEGSTAATEGAVAAAVEAPKVNPLTEAIKEMQAVHGDKSPHLWSLIDKKVDTMTDHLSGIADIQTLAGSEGQMTHIIDNIKDQIAENPQAFGLTEGTNIDLLTSADLERISQDPHFNELIANMFKPGSFADQAQNLSETAIRSIEANNDYYQGVASQLEGDVRLDQAAYDAMDKMHDQGLSTEAAASALQQAHDTATGPVAETEAITENLNKASIEQPIASTLPLETQNIINESVKNDTVAGGLWKGLMEARNGGGRFNDNPDNIRLAGEIFSKAGLSELPNHENIGVSAFYARDTVPYHFKLFDTNSNEQIADIAVANDSLVLIREGGNIAIKTNGDPTSALRRMIGIIKNI